MKSLHLTFLSFVLNAYAFGQTNLVADQVEFDALKTLWQNTGGSTWTNNTGWPTAETWPAFATATEMDNWYGVIVMNGDVVGLRLNSNNLSGTIPSALGKLTKLQQLFLQKNSLHGTIPADIGNLLYLEYFYLNENQLTGSIPSSLSGLTRLVYFVVNDNQLSGSIPPIFSGMTALSDVFLQNNRFSGVLPPMTGVTLNVSNNSFSGAFPSVTRSTTGPVWIIYASNNSFTSLPGSFSSCPSLAWVDFVNNELVSLPSSLATHVNKANMQLLLQNNRLDFSTLELYRTGFRTPVLLPQKSINDLSTQTLVVGSPLVLSARQATGSTSFTWEKQLGNGVWSTVSNDQDGIGWTYTRSSATTRDAGRYRWKSTNQGFPGATIQSEAIEVKTTIGFTLDNWCFQYKYDGRKRITHKKVPGVDWVYLVYDDRDRLVMTQDGEQRKSNKWTVTKYDALNRPVITAIYTHSAYITQAGMDSLVSRSLFAESYNGVGLTGYTNSVFPTNSLEILTVNYYDNYAFTGSNAELMYKTDQLDGQYRYNSADNTAFPRVVGMITGTKVKVLNAPAPYYLTSLSYYDDRGRVVQTVSENYDAGVDRVTNNYDFSGKVTSTRTTHSIGTIAWRSIASAQVEGNCVVRIPNGNTWGGMSSVQFIPSGKDGWVEGFVTETSTARFFGLSQVDTDVSPLSVDYGFYLNGTTLSVYEFGVLKYTVPVGGAPGDRLRIARVGTTIKFYKNGGLVYTAAKPSSGNLYADVSLRTDYARILNLSMSASIVTQSTLKIFDYDHAGRLISTRHSLNDRDTVFLAKNEYNELGQLVDKKLHSTNAMDFHQSVDYRYNIRGWLTSMNGSELNSNTARNYDTQNDRRDLFGIDLLYNETIDRIGNIAMYNGNISAMRWSNNFGLGDTKERAYKFSYDPMNRLTGAAHWTYSGQWHSASAFHESGVTYDLNGNIKSLVRTGESGELMDSLKYDYGSGNATGNELRKVSDAGMPMGFSDGTNVDSDYVYDNNGNLVSDKNKSISLITYNHLNLPVSVVKSTGESILYCYDATGRKLSQVVKNANGSQKKKTSYHGDYIYENDTLIFVNHDEGRVLPDGTYEYHLKDHLGNVRLTFTTKEDRTESVANFETETADFIYYNEAVKVNSQIFDHTDSGSTFYSTRLNGTVAERYGVAKSLSVMPGDTVNVKVFVKYLDPDTTLTAPLGYLIGSIADGTAAAGVFKDGGLVGSTGGVLKPFWSLFTGVPENAGLGVPKAYLNWLVFDRNYVLRLAGAKQVSSKAAEHGEDGFHEELSKQLVATEAGYVYVYLSNDNYALTGKKVDVFFDDFTVEHVKSPVIQMQDYYSFGLVFNSYRRENSLSNQYQYNGKEIQDELNIGWLDYGKRFYEPALGRWNIVDARSEKYSSWSPYNYVLGNPLSNVDPKGDTVTIQVTNTVVGKTDINLYTKGETQGQNAVAQETTEVNVYQVNVTNEEGSSATFYYTRDAWRKDASNTSADAENVTFDVQNDGDSFQGAIKSRWSGTDNVLELRKFDDINDQQVEAMKNGENATRTAIQFHVKGATDGCLMAVGSNQFNSTTQGVTIDNTNLSGNSSASQTNFMQKIADFRQADVDAGKSNFIKVTFQKSN